MNPWIAANFPIGINSLNPMNPKGSKSGGRGVKPAPAGDTPEPVSRKQRDPGGGAEPLGGIFEPMACLI